MNAVITDTDSTVTVQLTAIGWAADLVTIAVGYDIPAVGLGGTIREIVVPREIVAVEAFEAAADIVDRIGLAVERAWFRHEIASSIQAIASRGPKGQIWIELDESADYFDLPVEEAAKYEIPRSGEAVDPEEDNDTIDLVAILNQVVAIATELREYAAERPANGTDVGLAQRKLQEATYWIVEALSPHPLS